MFTNRRRKLVLAAAILLVGLGTALYFPLESGDPAAETPRATATTKLPPMAPTSANPSGKEPRLAGHIETYNAKQSSPNHPSSQSGLDITSGDDAPVMPPSVNAAKLPEAHLGQGPPPAAEAGLIGAVTNVADDERGSTLKWQTVRRPAHAASMSIDESLRALDERPAVGPTPAARRHKIVDGDTLARLAHRYLGSETRLFDLFEYNRDVLASPELLPIGKELRIPPAGYTRPTFPLDEPQARSSASRLTPISTTVTAPPPTTSTQHKVLPSTSAAPLAATQTYVVQPHDTLGLIARRFYGDHSRQREILAANTGQLHSPADLRAGMTLVVPARADAR